MRIAMMAITTNSSMSVKPRRFDLLMVFIVWSVEADW
jgi:hypothetical protein